MKRITTKRKIEIFEGAIRELKRSVFVGFCYGIKNGSDYSYDIFDFPELMKYDPKNHNIYWFPRNEQGQKKRIQILRKEIRLLKAKLKK